MASRLWLYSLGLSPMLAHQTQPTLFLQTCQPLLMLLWYHQCCHSLPLERKIVFSAGLWSKDSTTANHIWCNRMEIWALCGEKPTCSLQYFPWYSIRIPFLHNVPEKARFHRFYASQETGSLNTNINNKSITIFLPTFWHSKLLTINNKVTWRKCGL